MRDHKHQPRALQPIHHETQGFERHGIGPMQVFDDDQQRRQRQAPVDDGAHRVENLPPQLLGPDVLQAGVGIAKAEHMEQQRHQIPGLLAVEAEIGQQSGELGPHLARRIAQHHAGGAAHNRGNRAVGLLAKRRAGGSPHRYIGKALLVAEAGDEFVDKPRFADAGFADQANKLGRTGAGEIEAVQHAREFAVASDQRRAETQRLKPARRPRCFKRSDQPMHQNAAGLAAQRDVAERFECRTRAASAGR